MMILVLESSTSSAKAMLYHSEKGAVSTSSKNYKAEDNVGGKQNTHNIFLQTMQLGKQLAQGQKIDMVSLCSAWHGVVVCDKEMNPVTPTYAWTYTGAADTAKRLRADEDYTGSYYHRTGCMVHSTYPAFKLLHLKESGLSLGDKYIAGQGSYNFYHLTGERATTPCMVSAAGLLDIAKWSYDAPILEEIGISDEQLGRLITYKETKPLSRQGAELLGLKPGIPVVPPHGDGALNQVGAGALKEGVMTFSVGTSAAIRLTTDGVRLPQKPSTWCYLTADTWLSGAAISGACSNVDWAKNTLFPAGTTYKEIEDGFSDSNDLPVFMPFLYGERCPAWKDDRRSGFCGVLPWHTANDLYLSVLECVLFNMYQCYEVLCSLNPAPHTIKLSGGILRSEVWTQMCADIFGHDMQCSRTEQSSLLGGAVLAMAASGVLKDPRSFEPEPDDVVKPNLEKQRYYSRRYNEYCHWYNKTMIND